ncbi:hypothetical protein RvY_10219 [Ramazzottius varieornatus]|uniref:Uncharacterized protein n=1 Tax=Ramazzottius varieornatus TaxID=947166 RepID=A0A1D1VJU0_RAMVA|nr:hypothetical protein RvY_10219 [Ramazzottius varieornatus]
MISTGIDTSTTLTPAEVTESPGRVVILLQRVTGGMKEDRQKPSTSSQEMSKDYEHERGSKVAATASSSSKKCWSTEVGTNMK